MNQQIFSISCFIIFKLSSTLSFPKDSNKSFAALLDKCIYLIFFRASGILFKIVRPTNEIHFVMNVVFGSGTNTRLGFLSFYSFFLIFPVCFHF